jgi:hypothetical protein
VRPRRAFWRPRIGSAVIVVASAVIITLPGSFPLWMKAEQGVAGLFMIGVAVQSRPQLTNRHAATITISL